MIRWKASRAPASSPARIAPDDLDQELREPEPGHRPDRAATQLLEQHDRAEAAEDAQVRSRGQQPADLGRAGLVLELDDPARRRAVRDGRAAAPTDIVTPLLAGWSWTTTGSVDRAGDRQVVGEDGVVVRAGEGRRREHHRVRAGRLGLAGVGDRPVRGRVVTPTQTGRSPAAASTPADDRAALGVGQLGRLAEHAQDGHAVDAAAGHEPGQRRQARLVERAVRRGTASGRCSRRRLRRSAAIAGPAGHR